MKLDNYLKLGNEVIRAKNTCSKAGSSCDFHKGEHCCPSLACFTTRGSDKSECRVSVVDETDGGTADGEILSVLRRPYLSLEQAINSKINEQLRKEEEEEKEEGEDEKWELRIIAIPPRLDDMTELPKCAPVNVRCHPLSGITACCLDLTCMQIGLGLEEFECRRAPDENKKVMLSTYEDEKSSGRLHWFLGGSSGRKSKKLKGEGSERIDDDEVLFA